MAQPNGTRDQSEARLPAWNVSGVAAGVSPAVEPGILPGGNHAYPKAPGHFQITEQRGVLSGRQDAALYGSQDGSRYAKHPTKLISRGIFASADVIE